MAVQFFIDSSIDYLKDITKVHSFVNDATPVEQVDNSGNK